MKHCVHIHAARIHFVWTKQKNSFHLLPSSWFLIFLTLFTHYYTTNTWILSLFVPFVPYHTSNAHIIEQWDNKCAVVGVNKFGWERKSKITNRSRKQTKVYHDLPNNNRLAFRGVYCRLFGVRFVWARVQYAARLHRIAHIYSRCHCVMVNWYLCCYDSHLV